jgi:hypothetical protein
VVSRPTPLAGEPKIPPCRPPQGRQRGTECQPCSDTPRKMIVPRTRTSYFNHAVLAITSVPHVKKRPELCVRAGARLRRHDVSQREAVAGRLHCIETLAGLGARVFPLVTLSWNPWGGEPPQQQGKIAPLTSPPWVVSLPSSMSQATHLRVLTSWSSPTLLLAPSQELTE